MLILFEPEIAAISPIERPFVPDGSKDLGGVWAEPREPSPQQVAPTQRKLAKPNALMFFHIPLYVSHSSWCPLVIVVSYWYPARCAPGRVYLSKVLLRESSPGYV